MIGLIYMYDWIVVIRACAFSELLFKVNGCTGRLIKTLTVIEVPARSLE